MRKHINFLKIILFILLFSGFSNLEAQVIMETQSGKFPISKFKAEHLDSTQQVIYYEYKVVKEDLNNKISTKTNKVLLQIGSRYSKFTDLSKIQNDSLVEKETQTKNYLTDKKLNEGVDFLYRRNLKKEIFKNLQANQLIIRSRFELGYFEYEMKIPDFSWEIQSEKKEILGYTVQKADLEYAGRNWTAWYAEEIPIPSGPYIFEGLPGLILEMYDKEEIFHFTAIAIENKKKEIYKKIEDDITKTNREEYFQLEKRFHENPNAYFSDYKEHGYDKIPYTPIEIIDK